MDYPIEEIFESAVTIVRNLPKDGPVKPSNETRLKFYAYYKQATEGPNKTPKPGFFSGPTNWYKWDAWNKLGDLSKEDAMLGYINALKKSMDDVPKDTPPPDDTKIFKEVLGKKFYDYWFTNYQKSNGYHLAATGDDVMDTSMGEKTNGILDKSQDTTISDEVYMTPQADIDFGKHGTQRDTHPAGPDSNTAPLATFLSNQFKQAIIVLHNRLQMNSLR